MCFIVLEQFANFFIIRAVAGNDFEWGIFFDAFDECNGLALAHIFLRNDVDILFVQFFFLGSPGSSVDFVCGWENKVTTKSRENAIRIGRNFIHVFIFLRAFSFCDFVGSHIHVFAVLHVAHWNKFEFNIEQPRHELFLRAFKIGH